MATSNLSWNKSKEHKDNCPEEGMDWSKFKREVKDELTQSKESIDIDWLIYDVLILKAECLANQKLLSYCQHLEDQLFRLKNREAELEV